MQIFVLMASEGDYSDRTEWAIRAYDSEAAVRAAITQLDATRDELEQLSQFGSALKTDLNTLWKAAEFNLMLGETGPMLNDWDDDFKILSIEATFFYQTVELVRT